MVPPTEAGSTAERTEQEGRHGFVQIATLTPLNDAAEQVLGQTAEQLGRFPHLSTDQRTLAKGG